MQENRKKHKVKACCSLAAGIFIMTAANAMEGAKKQGKNLNIPYWYGESWRISEREISWRSQGPQKTVGKGGFCDYSKRKKIRCQGLSEISD
jgi:hypothetical protein